MQGARSVLFGLVALVGVGLGCASLVRSDGPPPLERNSVDLVLENRSWDLGIFRVFDRGSQLGVFRVPALTADTVTVQPTGSTLTFRIRPLAHREVWSPERVSVEPGDVVQVTMQNHLSLSSVSIFPVGEDYWLARYDHPEAVVFNGLERVDPPRRWYDWWEDAEACSGLESDFQAITWFVTPSMYWLKGVERPGTAAIYALNGLHWGDNIYVRVAMVDSARLIRHEALHNILRANGVSDSVNAAHEHPAYEACRVLENKDNE